MPKQIQVSTIVVVVVGVLVTALVVVLAVSGGLFAARPLAGAAGGSEVKTSVNATSSQSTSPSTLVEAIFGQFSPAYPSGSGYSTFVDTLDDLSIGGVKYLSDLDNSGSLANDRCSENAIGSLWIGQEALAVATLAEVATASALPAPSNAIAWGVWGVTAGVELGFQIVADQCAFQDSLVDSAEIEAAYENTVTIIDHQNYATELRQVHMKVVEIKARTEFLVAVSEAGLPVDVTFTGVQVTARNNVSFIDVLSASTVTQVGDGLYFVEIDLPQSARSANLFVFEVEHADTQLNHYGFTLFDRGPE